MHIVNQWMFQIKVTHLQCMKDTPVTVCRTSPTTRQPLSTHYNIIISSWDTFPGVTSSPATTNAYLRCKHNRYLHRIILRKLGAILARFWAQCTAVLQTDRSGDCSTAAAIRGLHAAEWSCSWRGCDHSEYFYGNRNISLESWHQSPAPPARRLKSEMHFIWLRGGGLGLGRGATAGCPVICHLIKQETLGKLGTYCIMLPLSQICWEVEIS